MAQINLTIVAESAEELKGILLDLADIVEATGAVVAEASGAGAAAVAEAKPRRGKGRPAGSKNRVKTPEEVTAQEAEAARKEVERIEAEKAENGDADAIANAAAKATAETPVDVATANPLPPTEPEKSDVPPPTVTVDAVRDILKQLVKSKGRDAAMKLLMDLGKVDKLPDLTEDCYEAVFKAAQKALEIAY